MNLIHANLSTTLTLYTAVMVGWSFLLYVRRQELDSSYFGALLINELVFVVQAVLGVILSFQGASEGIRWVHILYGVLAVITIPAIYSYTRGENNSRIALFYGIVLLFLVGVILRAGATAVVAG